jgi:hypothetical protein
MSNFLYDYIDAMKFEQFVREGHVRPLLPSRPLTTGSVGRTSPVGQMLSVGPLVLNVSNPARADAGDFSNHSNIRQIILGSFVMLTAMKVSEILAGNSSPHAVVIVNSNTRKNRGGLPSLENPATISPTASQLD